MYALYGDPGYFKFKRKDQQYGSCFKTIFPFLMTMEKLNNFIADIAKNLNIPQYEDHLVKTDNIDDPILRAKEKFKNDQSIQLIKCHYEKQNNTFCFSNITSTEIEKQLN